MSIKDNYLLLSPKLRRKETSGDEQQEDTMGPGDQASERLSRGGDAPVSRVRRNLSLEGMAAWKPIGNGQASYLPMEGRSHQPAMAFAVGSSAEDPSEVQTLFTSAWELLHQYAIKRIIITNYSALSVSLGRTKGSGDELSSGS